MHIRYFIISISVRTLLDFIVVQFVHTVSNEKTI